MGEILVTALLVFLLIVTVTRRLCFKEKNDEIIITLHCLW